MLTHDIVSCVHKGSCVTSVLPGEVCGLDAVATECPEASLMATTCTCVEDGFQYDYQDAACRGQLHQNHCVLIKVHALYVGHP